MGTTINVEGWTVENLGKLQHNIGEVHENNLPKVYKTRSSLKSGDFSGYRATFDTSKLKPRVRYYGSVKGGAVGTISGFKDKDESWRMLNVLTHDRQLHQRYGTTLVEANFKYEDNAKKVKRGVKRLIG